LKRTSKNVKNSQKQSKNGQILMFFSLLMDNLSQYDGWTALQPFTMVFYQIIREIHDYCRPLTSYDQLSPVKVTGNSQYFLTG
jgi:hypothetical protein